jgi:HPt (histidine-containing phosphotransfer) domain-containing protein
VVAGDPGHDLCFNKDQLYERFAGDDEMITMVLDAFFQEAPELIAQIRLAIAGNDAEGVRSAAHALKGSAANVSADLLRNAALRLETSAKEGSVNQFSLYHEMIQTEYNIFVQEATQ